MFRSVFSPIFIIFVLAGCAGFFSSSRIDSTHERDIRMGNVPSKLHPEWAKADRCTKCHVIWSQEHGYYRPWDRHGFICDYKTTAPYAYKDPWGPGGPPFNTYADYYYFSWWDGPWLDEPVDIEPPMHFGGYGRVNDGTATPKDFSNPVIVVDQSGNGDTKTIQEAVTKAGPGMTVFVRPGSYNETIRLREGIRLWGQDWRTTIIDPDYTGHAIIAANNCDISGFTITGTGMNYKSYEFTAGVYALDCDSTLVIRGCFFDSNAVYGILVEASRTGGTPVKQNDRYIPIIKSLENISYSGYPNPHIIGNTFYMTGERAIYSIHAIPEICNNIFIGNVKAIGMTAHARPFIHNNVFWRNNVPININRSMPVVSYNIMVRNYWGQRIIEGSLPVIHHNVTCNSPWYREFDEAGQRISYNPLPGVGEIHADPRWVDPDNGDFGVPKNSPLLFTDKNKSYGLVSGPDFQQPPKVVCKESYAENFVNWTPELNSIAETVEMQNARIEDIQASYTIEYESFMNVEYTDWGDQKKIHISSKPVSGIHYDVPIWTINGQKRRKTYMATMINGSISSADSGTVCYNNGKLTVSAGRFASVVNPGSDPHAVGECPTRENYGGLYLDYDQYLNGAIGPGGTFFFGYFRILGGIILEKKEIVNNHECVVVIYPHIGEDQIFKYYLDPAIGYRPRKMEQYFNHELYRRIDGYEYREFDNIFVPVKTVITDFVVKGPEIGTVAGTLTMTVRDITVNFD